jgi:hypothetical protein
MHRRHRRSIKGEPQDQDTKAVTQVLDSVANVLERTGEYRA